MVDYENPHIAEIRRKIGGEDVTGRYYIINLLVHELDGSRILGPYDEETLSRKKRQYMALVKRLPKRDRKDLLPLPVFQHKEFLLSV